MEKSRRGNRLYQGNLPKLRSLRGYAQNLTTAIFLSKVPYPRTTHAPDRIDQLLSTLVAGFTALLILAPEAAFAQSLSATGTFGGITDFLASITNLLIFQWGYYIGILTLAIQGYRWKTGRIDLMTLGGWGFGICLVFFAPGIVKDLRDRASTTL